LLQDFRCGDSETGTGGQLSDGAVVRLAIACPNLIHASLDGSKRLTDASLLAFFTNCPNLCYLAITGNDKVMGELKGPALDELRENPDLGKKLVKIRITYQSVYEKRLGQAIKMLSAARKKMAIEVGEPTTGVGMSVLGWEARKRWDIRPLVVRAASINLAVGKGH
jgi:hypothetical protein